MSKPLENPADILRMTKNIVLQYERLIKEYPQCRNLPETLEIWKTKEKELEEKSLKNEN